MGMEEALAFLVSGSGTTILIISRVVAAVADHRLAGGVFGRRGGSILSSFCDGHRHGSFRQKLCLCIYVCVLISGL